MSAPTPRPVLRADLDRLTADWSFAASTPPVRVRVLRARARLLRRRAAPAWRVIRPVVAAERWNALFLFAPHGTLDVDQHELVARLRRLAGRLLVVVATPDPAALPAGLDAADALVWKAPHGFDMSAYGLALRLVADASPGALTYLQNDSVFGPFGDVDAAVARAPWDLTGFLASRSVENHLSSYALIVRDVTPGRCAALAPVLSPRWCYDGFAEVVLDQETRLSRIAARHMSVGAYWYMPDATPVPPLHRSLANRLWGEPPGRALDLSGNILLSRPLECLDAGHPFLKRSLFGKFAGVADPLPLRRRLAALGWPL